MPFVRVAANHPRALTGKVAVAIGIPPSTPHAASLKVRFGSEVAQLGRFSVGQRCEVLWGHGIDAGKVLVQRASSGGVVLRGPGARKSGDALTLSFGSLPRHPIADDKRAKWALGIVKRSSTRCPWELHPTGGLLVTLPREWWSVEAGGSTFNPYPRRVA
jgi:hypothetical protein